eukprot:4114050-Pyramimonas_sp.AAC.1
MLSLPASLRESCWPGPPGRLVRPRLSKGSRCRPARRLHGHGPARTPRGAKTVPSVRHSRNPASRH